MNLNNPQNIPLTSLVDEIELGKIKVPQFQRSFVWNIDKVSELMDSLIKGYPIGTCIVWKTQEHLKIVRQIGNLKLPDPPKGDYVNYILDGQQRLTSIYASIKGLEVEKGRKTIDFSKIYVDLTAEANEKIVITNVNGKDKNSFISIKDLIDGDISTLYSFPKKYHKRIGEYTKVIQSFAISVIYVNDAPIDIAIEIYTRINEGGKSLSSFEIMVAKTFSLERSFDLGLKDRQLKNVLRKVDYNTIQSSTVLQTVSVLLVKECSQKSIYKLDKEEFIDIWDEAVESIKIAIDYFRTFYRIPTSKLLPYDALLIAFSYFFYKNNNRKPNKFQQDYLQDFFWRTSITDRYSHSVESRLVQDIIRIDNILIGKEPVYDYPVNMSPQYIMENGSFNVGRSYIKAILCLYMYFEPKSFDDNSKINVSNDHLNQRSSKNYHHFFPINYLRSIETDERKVDHILNITVVDEHLNKIQIGRKPPATYMSKFIKENKQIEETMRTHLINNIDDFGIMSNNYDAFLNKRAELVSEELNKRIIIKKNKA